MMKGKRYVFFFIITVSLIVNIYQCWYGVHNEKESLNNLKVEYNKRIIKRESAYHMLKEDIMLNYQNNGLQLPFSEIEHQKNIDGHSLNDIISDKTLVVRLSQQNCEVCVNTLMSLLKKANIKNVVFLVNYEVQHFLENLKLYKVKGYFFKIGDLGIPIESMNLPYMFVLNKDYIVNKIYVPHDSMTDQTLSYLKYVQEYIENN